MVLRSFSFGIVDGVDELPVDVLKLFSPLVENPEKTIKYGSEIINNSLKGKINLNAPFNLDAYEATIDKNLRLAKSGERKRKVYLDFNDSDRDDPSRDGSGVSYDLATVHTLDLIQDAYEEFINDDELKYAVEAITELQPVLLVEENVDFLFTIRQALRGIPSSVKIVKDICEKYSVVAEQVKVVLSADKPFEEIFSVA